MTERMNKENPDIIWDLYIADINDIEIPSTKSISRTKLINHIEDSISWFRDDSIYFEDDENLYFYLDLTNLNCTYIGYEEAAKLLPKHCRIPLKELLSEKRFNSFGEAYADMKKIKKFIRENVPSELFKKKANEIQ
ncbi:MAG: hypothetical protein HDS83_08320 [Bacteroidales bacterium]|nr:hypothetical protein [Bacteroidales bacterium]